jgi:hypothetical protein
MYILKKLINFNSVIIEKLKLISNMSSSNEYTYYVSNVKIDSESPSSAVDIESAASPVDIESPSTPVDIPVDIESVTSPVEKNLNEPKKYENILFKMFSYFSYFIFFLLVLGFIGCVIANIVFEIMSLCQLSYSEQKDKCQASNAWVYILVNLILSFSAASSVNKEKKDNFSILHIIQICILLGMTIWGIYEFFGVNCLDNIKSTLLYTMLEVEIIFYIIYTGIFLVYFVILCNTM